MCHSRHQDGALTTPAAQPEDEDEVREPPARPIFWQPVIVPNQVGLGAKVRLRLRLRLRLTLRLRLRLRLRPRLKVGLRLRLNVGLRLRASP